MASAKHINPPSGVAPYHSLFHTVTAIPSGTSLAYISTQWAGDEASNVLHPDNYREQSKVIWTNIAGILKEMGCSLKDVVHRIVTFKDFTDDIGKDVVEGMMEGLSDEDKQHALASSLRFVMAAGFHKPGIVYTVDCVVAVNFSKVPDK